VDVRQQVTVHIDRGGHLRHTGLTQLQVQQAAVVTVGLGLDLVDRPHDRHRHGGVEQPAERGTEPGQREGGNDAARDEVFDGPAEDSARPLRLV
jgi:hypothetical protein